MGHKAGRYNQRGGSVSTLENETPRDELKCYELIDSRRLWPVR
jgi:hypothetical protein